MPRGLHRSGFAVGPEAEMTVLLVRHGHHHEPLAHDATANRIGEAVGCNAALR